MLDEVKARLEQRVPECGTIKTAVDWSSLMRSGTQPVGGVNTFLLPGDVVGGAAEAATGAFTQAIRDGVQVVTMLQSTDARGTRALERIEDHLKDLREAVAGWAPGDTVGVFTFVRQRFVPDTRGVLSVITEFAIDDQLRTTP
ncbi:phage tail terminator protein [Sagittula sp. S175]|uniref:phage tail terminator protein n=1 Tax=Sagittula sp. S175 TaxID=3415129 RepID=UPI003C79806C